MQGYNLIVVFHETENKMLMCKRRGNPYKGLLNFVGGKIENGESGIDAAYRELQEETAITKEDIILTHLMDFTYYLDNCCIEVYVGKLNKSVRVEGDENDLYWSALDKDFFDSAYAGEGNIGHIMKHIEMAKDELLFSQEDMMEEYRYITLMEKPELKEQAATWFHNKWGAPREAYLECMNAYLNHETDYGWYLCLCKDRIVGGMGVIENDFHDRKDLSPNVCAVYTEEDCRCRGIAGKLL